MSGSLRRSVSMLLQTKGKRDNRHFITIKTFRNMANWASTSYVIDDFMSGRKQPVEETASDDWEGNIVKTLGATDEQMKKYLRGFIQWYDFDGCVLRIDAEEAWGATDFHEVLAELMGRENVSKEELDKWNEEQEDYDAYIYVHEYKVVA